VAACIAASPASAAREAPDASAWSKSARAATASPDRTAAKSAPWGNGGGAVGLGSGPRAAPRGRGSLAARGISSRVGGREGGREGGRRRCHSAASLGYGAVVDYWCSLGVACWEALCYSRRKSARSRWTHARTHGHGATRDTLLSKVQTT
jgi:hypothetical protein